MRIDGRLLEETRPVTIQREYTCYAPGSVLIETGKTIVLCSAMVESRVPRHCLGSNMGWVTAEYSMLPSANPERRSIQGAPGGRASEIQRLIGRSLRSAVDLHRFPGKTIWIDCTVIQADGGTRTAAVSGGFVALVDALWGLRQEETIDCMPLIHRIAAISVGIVDGTAVVDLCADEDRTAQVDMNVVATHTGDYVEVQGTAERMPFSPAQHAEMLELAQAGIRDVVAAQTDALADRLPAE